MVSGFSFLIPTYNKVCVDLVQELLRQISKLSISAEVVVVDDASTDVSTIEQNNVINTFPNSKFIRNEVNSRQAYTRNKLAQIAQGEYLIFLDSDVFPSSATFVEQYVACANYADVVVGGLRYRVPNQKVCPLRLMFGLKSEVRTVAERNIDPYAKFAASNALINAKVFKRIQFDDKIKKYGYEDVLFGQELQHLGFSVRHIDNPVFHDDDDTSEQFLNKTRTSLQTLHSIATQIGDKSHINNVYQQLKKWHLVWGMQLFFRLTQTCFEHNLLSQHPNMLIFNLYKLGYYCCLSHEDGK